MDWNEPSHQVVLFRCRSCVKTATRHDIDVAMNFAGTAVSLTFKSGSDSYFVVVLKDFFVKVYTASDVDSLLAVTRDIK